MMKKIHFVVFVAVIGLPAGLRADMFPQPSVDAMCDEADLIIEGTYLGKNEVRIDRIHKGSSLLKDGTKTLEVSQLSRHSRSLDIVYGGKAIQTNKLVLFLMREEKSREWKSISTIDDSGRCGSCGLFWYDDTTCYGYQQNVNPGPYVLAPGPKSRQRVPESIDVLRAEIKTGLANSREWRRSLAIEDRADRAEALARYLLKRTSPEGDKGTYLYAVREPLASLGKDAVPALIHALRTAPAGERLDPTVLILYDIGPPAAQAIPDLAALLSQADRVHTVYALIALGSTGDPRAVPYLEQYLKNEDKNIAKGAEDALFKLQENRSKTRK